LLSDDRASSCLAGGGGRVCGAGDRSSTLHAQLDDISSIARSSELSSATAAGSHSYYSAIMPNVLVRDIPEEVHATLRRRAEQRGQSLQQYLVGELTRLAERPTLSELLNSVERRRGGRVGLRQAAADIADERARA